MAGLTGPASFFAPAIRPVRLPGQTSAIEPQRPREPPWVPVAVLAIVHAFLIAAGGLS